MKLPDILDIAKQQRGWVVIDVRIIVEALEMRGNPPEFDNQNKTQ